MGASQSAPKGNIGLHVLRVAEGSPAADSQIEPYFDFLVGYNGIAMSADTDAFLDAVDDCEQARTQIILQRKADKTDVRIRPSKDWSIADKNRNEDAEPSLLGLSLRVCSPEGALEQVWHILDILEGSPAQAAGLVNFGDYVIGYPGGVLRGEGDFYNLVEEHTDRPLRLFVYNSDFDVTREVVIVPNRDWGDGDSLLGCGVGYGLLHRIPKPQDRPAQTQNTQENGRLSPNGQPKAVTRRNASISNRDDLEESDDEQDGVELIDTARASPVKASANARQTQNSNGKAAQLPISGRRSPEGRQQAVERGPPVSPSYRHSKRSNSVAEVLVEEEE